MRVYYNEFEFEPADFSAALVFLFTFLARAAIVLLIYVMAKKRVFDKLKQFKFIRGLMSEFNEEEVGNNLVLEVMDYVVGTLHG